MVTVDADFHSLITAPGANTRIRIYFIDDTIDCTDDNDVETNGMLLAYDADTDSNALIDSSSGLSIFESFNKDDASKYTRSWFAWQNTLFGELILKLIDDGKLDLLRKIQKSPH